MSRHIAPECMFELPSGNRVHPCRLIHKDGTMMWKHALLNRNALVAMPQCLAHEAHIIKTAQRIEELNSWVSQNLDPWDCLIPLVWYSPSNPELCEGISLYFRHNSLNNQKVYDELQKHILDHETLKLTNGDLYFRRC